MRMQSPHAALRDGGQVEDEGFGVDDLLADDDDYGGDEGDFAEEPEEAPGGDQALESEGAASAHGSGGGKQEPSKVRCMRDGGRPESVYVHASSLRPCMHDLLHACVHSAAEGCLRAGCLH